MRDSTASVLRASIIAVAAVALTALSAMPIESSYSASSQRAVGLGADSTQLSATTPHTWIIVQ